jgi:putative transcriptional regulator
MYRTWLIEKRESVNKSQEDVAIESGISRQYYGMIENNERNPSVEVAKKISLVLNFNWTIFFENIGNETFPIENQPTA